MAIHTAMCLATLLGVTCPAFAQDCRLALAPALDVPSSVDVQEDMSRFSLHKVCRTTDFLTAISDRKVPQRRGLSHSRQHCPTNDRFSDILTCLVRLWSP